MTDDDIVPETHGVSICWLQDVAGTLLQCMQRRKPRTLEFFCIIGWKFCMFVDARSNLACTLLVVTPEN